MAGETEDISIKKTICSVCHGQCGIDAYVSGGRLVKVKGTEDNPSNRGILCMKGASNTEYVHNQDRLLTPMRRKGPRGSGDFEPITWDEALDGIADRLKAIRKESGPESVIFFAGYPKWFRPFLKRLAHSFGSPNFCTESSTCFLATVLASRLTYGCGASPDLKNTACILNWSTNPHNSAAPRVPQFQAARERGAKIIDVGPLTTPLSAKADIHLRLRPGTSGALALAMANVIISEGLHDKEFVGTWTLGFDEYRSYAREFPPETAERITGVPAEKIVEAARMYASTKPACLVTSASVTVHHTNGVQNHRAVLSLVGLTGNFDRKGGNHVIPPSYYHRPTGLATREAEFEQSRPWEEMAPRIGEGLFPVWAKLIGEAQATELPFQIQSGTPYPVRAVVGFGLNHRMWPGSDFMAESLKKLDLLVDIDLFMTDTAKLADIVLPAASSFERSELTIYPPRYAFWTNPVIDAVGVARSDVDIILDLARRLDLDDPLLAAGHEACLEWIFEPSGIKMADVKAHPDGAFLSDRSGVPYEKYRTAGFPTPSGKMEFTSTVLGEAGFDPLPVYREPAQSPVSAPEAALKYPLILTTGARLPMYMHSRMYRIPRSKKLRPDPMADLNPADARTRNLTQGQWVTLSTPRGAIRVRANLTDSVPPGVVSVYHGWPGADANELIDPAYRDPVSGYPGYKSLLCEVEAAGDHGRAFRARPTLRPDLTGA